MKRSTTSRTETQRAMERVNGYVRDVLSEKQIACQKVQQACRRHLNDLERAERDPAYPWVFDERKAARPIRFMERYLRPTKGTQSKMELMPWECFVEASLYGWVSRETGLRRYREGLIGLGRKNGKSTLMSGNSSYGATKDGEYGADIFLLANSRAQAGIVYETCRSQILASPVLRGSFRALRSALYYDATQSSIQTLSSDSHKQDGLNPHMAIFDEIHESKDFKLFNVMRNGMGARSQPLMLYITTMGTVLDGPLAQYYDRFTKAMDGTLPAEIGDRMFMFFAELDSLSEIDQPDMWVKANPSLGVLIDPKQMRLDWERAKLVPSERADFITKRFNIMVDASEASFLDAEVINRNRRKVDMASLEGRCCTAGYDLSCREDFTAAALEFELDDGSFFWLQHSWVPRRKVDLAQERVEYYSWAMRGYLTIVEGEYVEQKQILEWFAQQKKHYKILAIGYDPWNAQWLNAELEKQFKTQAIRPGPLTLNDPMKDVREKMLDGRIIHNDDEMLRWYMHNVRLRNDYRDRDKENWVPVKRSRYKKIDGFMACLTAHAVTISSAPQPKPGDMRIRIIDLD